MIGVVATLDEAHERRVRALWAEVAEVAGLGAVAPSQMPHVSFHVAAGYGLERAGAIVAAIGGRVGPGRARVQGLGIFTGPRPVVYLAVARTPWLDGLHQALWHELAPVSEGAVGHYHPDHWAPHITLAAGGLDAARVAAIAGQLADRPLAWEVPLDNLTVLEETDSGHASRQRVPLRVL